MYYLIHIDMKPDVDDVQDEEEEAELAAEISQENLGSLWDDDDTKSFYQNIPDLIATIPSILYKANIK